KPRRVARQCSHGRLVSPESMRAWDSLADENATTDAAGHLGSMSLANPGSLVTRSDAERGAPAAVSKRPALAAVSTVSAWAGAAIASSAAVRGSQPRGFDLE